MLSEIDKAERLFLTYMGDTPDAPSGEELFEYFNEILQAYIAELDAKICSRK